MLPELLPPLLTGFALAFSRGIGEYGSVVFISGNMPMKTEIAPLLIMSKLEQFDYAGATAVALILLLISFVLLLLINSLQRRVRKPRDNGSNRRFQSWRRKSYGGFCTVSCP
ncbi:hypothetical protein HMSSN036_83290 [Paenibacillus macerans]|nr:hypothetical protein HMSSN036_83290 [Paenibacillus macerans]